MQEAYAESNNPVFWQPYCIIVIEKSFFFLMKASEHKGLRKAQEQTNGRKRLFLSPVYTIE